MDKNKFNKNSKFDFDNYHKKIFLERNEFEGIELLHWAFMGDKFLDEVKHILKCNPEHINVTNNFNDNALFISISNCSSSIFKYLISFENIDVFAENNFGNLAHNFFFVSPPDEVLSPSYDSALEGIQTETNYALNALEIIKFIDKYFPTYLTQKDVQGRTILEQMLLLPYSKLTNNKIKGLFLFLIETNSSILYEVNKNGDNLFHLLLERNDEDIIRFLNNNGFHDGLRDLFHKLNNNKENSLFKLFAHEHIKNQILHSNFLSFDKIMPHFSYSTLDIIEEFLDYDENKGIVDYQLNNKTIIDIITEYQEILEMFKSSDLYHESSYINQPNVDFLDFYFQYLKKFLSKYR